MLLPVVWLLHILALIGVNWILSLTQRRLPGPRRTSSRAVLMMILIVSPIAYTPEIVPDSLSRCSCSTRSPTSSSRTRRCSSSASSRARSTRSASSLLASAVPPRELVLRASEARDHRLCLSRRSARAGREDVQDLPEPSEQPPRRPRPAASAGSGIASSGRCAGSTSSSSAGAASGIIGRNGAGKTTLLKLITGNIAPTEGTLEVNGEVQALHGRRRRLPSRVHRLREHPRGAHAPGGRGGDDRGCVEEIAEFTELGEFLEQPFRTYSLGMQARLAFATATAVEPEILDRRRGARRRRRILLSKSAERMRGLVESGASLLLVSHSLAQITMFCDEAIWLDRGGSSSAAAAWKSYKAYQQFTRVLEERRLNAKNRKSWEGTTPSYALERLRRRSRPALRLADGSSVEIDETSRLLRDGKVEEGVAVGDAQDADRSHAAHLILEGSDSTFPLESDRGLARGLRAVPGGGVGSVGIDLYAIFEESRYAVELEARGRGLLAVEVLRGGKIVGRAEGRVSKTWATVGAVAGARTGAGRRGGRGGE